MREREKIFVYSIGPCNMSVCARNEATIEEITKFVNLKHPTGLDHGRTLSKKKKFSDGTEMPCRCDTHRNTRKHYLFQC